MADCILYISYDGLLEPLGQSQILQYLKELAKTHDITLLTYEKGHDWRSVVRRRELVREVRASGIRWIALRYHKSPTLLATSYDLALGTVVSLYLAWRHRCRIVHARSYVPAVIAYILQSLLGLRFVFDMRAFWPDEKVDIGDWRPNSPVYRIAKALERRFLVSADVVVSLTHAAVAAMQEFPYLRAHPPRFEVITTCTNLDHFRPARISESRSIKGFTLGYVGSVRGSYLFAPVLECFRHILALRPDAQLIVVNRDSHEYILESARQQGIPAGALTLATAAYSEVPRLIQQMDATAFFLKEGFSKKASVPTKLGEFLACGVPCLTNGVGGDIRPLLESSGVGIIKGPDMSTADAIRRLLDLCAQPGIRDRCVSVARTHFALTLGVQSYAGIYASLMTTSPRRAATGDRGNTLAAR